MGFYLERVQQGVDYIEAHLEGPLPLADVAQAAGLSQWHFQRIFKSITGETVMTYIRARRLAGAMEALAHSDLRILDVALLAGFQSQEAFARAFKRSFGLSPTQYRRFGSGGRFVKKLQVDEEYLKHVAQRLTRTPEIVQHPARQMVGLRTHFFGRDSDKNNVGERLPPLWAAFMARIHEIPHARPEVCYGVVVPEGSDHDGLVYHAAVEVEAAAPLPAGFVAVEVPSGTYASFAHRGVATDVDKTVSYAYGTWLAQSEWRHSGAPDLELYDARYHPTDASSVFHYALPLA